MALSGTIKVDSEVLIAKAAVVDECINKVNQYFDKMREIVLRSDSYWEGEAGDMHRRRFVEKDEMLNEILLRFKEHSRDLMKMADNYQKTEDTIEDQLVNQLPDNVIV